MSLTFNMIRLPAAQWNGESSLPPIAHGFFGRDRHTQTHQKTDFIIDNYVNTYLLNRIKKQGARRKFYVKLQN